MVCVYGSSNDALRRDDNRGMGRGGGGVVESGRERDRPIQSLSLFASTASKPMVT